MKRRGHTPEQIIRKLRDAERMLGEGRTIPGSGPGERTAVSADSTSTWRGAEAPSGELVDG